MKLFGIKSKFLKLLILLIISVLSFYIGAEGYKTNANGQEIFGFTDGAWIKVVDKKDVAENGDTNAIRFKFEVSKSYVENNMVTSLSAIAKIKLLQGGYSEIFSKNFNNLTELVSDGSFIHYFDFANIPKEYYSQQITVSVIATFENGNTYEVSQARSIDYVAARALSEADVVDVQSKLFNYISGDEIFTNKEENAIFANSIGEIVVDGYSGSEISSVYVNSILQSNNDILTANKDSNIVKIDASKLEAGKTYSILAFTGDNDIIYIKSIYISEPVEDIKQNEVLAFKTNSSTDITLNDSYSVKSIKLDDNELSGGDYSLNENILTLNNTSAFDCGIHTLSLSLNNQLNKVIIPLHIFDKKITITSNRAFTSWLASFSNQGVDSAYNYIVLNNNIDLSNASISMTGCVSGVFDGQGYTISNIFTSTSLFEKTNNFTMKNVGFRNVTFAEGSTFFVSKEAESASTKIINCYFNFSSSVKKSPILDARYIDLMQNAIFNIQLSYGGTPCLFKSFNPVKIKDVFVVGANVKGDSTTKILVARDTDQKENCGSYFSLDELKSTADLTNLQEYWNFDKSGHVWGTA